MKHFIQLLSYIHKNFRLENLYLYFLIVLSFGISFYLRLIPYLVAATGLSWLLSKKLNEKIKTLIKNRFFILIAFFYLLHVISFIYTENLQAGKLILESKLSLIILPIVILSSPLEIKSFFKRIVIAFISGITLSLIFCYIIALHKARLNAHPGELFNFAVWHDFDSWPLMKLIFSGISLLNYNWLSYFIHPSYISMYICFAIFILYFQLTDSKKITTKNKISRLVIIIFLTISLFLLQSRANIIVFGVIIIFESIYYLTHQRKIILKLTLSLVLLIILSLVIFNSYRFNLILNESSDYSLNKIAENNLRIKLWNRFFIIDNKWLIGFGVGDVQDNLNKISSAEYKSSDGKYLNFHNEFIETTASLGIFGLLILLALIFYPLIIRRSVFKNRIITVFVIIIAINFLFESMLLRLNGVAFFSLFYCLLNVNEDVAKKDLQKILF